MKILAIDPGGTVGFSLNVPLRTWQRKFERLELFRAEISEIGPDVLIYERFDNRRRTKVDHSAVRQIAIILEYAEGCSVTLVAQMPSDGKGYFDDRKLKHLGLYIPGRGHAMDALRHRLQYEMNQGMFDLNLLKGL